MGMLDSIQAEDRIQVKYSEFKNLIKDAVKVDLLTNAVTADVPHKYIRCMLTGKNDLLEEYKRTGVIPDEIKDMQQLLEQYRKTNFSPENVNELNKLYAARGKEIASLQRKNHELEKEIAGLKQNEVDHAVTKSGTTKGPDATQGDSEKESGPKDHAELQRLSGLCVPEKKSNEDLMNTLVPHVNPNKEILGVRKPPSIYAGAYRDDFDI